MARAAAAVDDLSGGRLTLGMGAGWQEREHEVFGFHLLDLDGRFARFQEGLECVTRLLQSEGPVTFEGRYYHLHEAQVLPRPQRPGGPRILIGGNGIRRTLPLAARYASEWNANLLRAADFKRANQRLDSLLIANGRATNAVRRSLMTGCMFAKDERGLEKKLAARGRSKQELLDRGIVVGVGSEINEQLEQLSEAGVQRIMLQWLELDDLEGLRDLARVVL
jgi:alkanesulfonate monooxygenase SsuD/methylene tetrahydromethanopterin reductase-like flavin-dependent oxidoreductase (luciferase family)